MRPARTPAGVTEVEFRRALASGSQRSLASVSSVDSAALQSEMAKKYNLAGAGQRKLTKRVSKLAPSYNTRIEAPSSSSLVCACCQTSYNGGEPICPNCGYYTNNLPQVPETLAQRRGLVPVAPKPAVLTPFDWSVIENSRTDPDSCCPICMEGFKQGHEVLLSCSHIFHRTCLRSFENFMKDNELTCPICRTRNYQKKITHIGSVAYSKVCAAKIQRLWRGYVVRKDFHIRLREYYRNLPHSERPVDEAQQARRKKYFQNEFNSITDKLNKNLDSRSNQVNSMLRSVDRTLVESQQLDLLFEQMLLARSGGQQAQQSAPHAAPYASAGARVGAGVEGVGHDGGALDLALEYADVSQQFCVEADTPWTEVYASALSRCPCDCAICMLPVAMHPTTSTSTNPNGNIGGNAGAAAVGAQRRDVVLSCAHIFHEKCIGNFEKFLSGSRLLTCPVCRSAYSKKLFRIVA